MKKLFLSLVILMMAGMQTAWAQKVVLHPTGKDPIEYDVSELDSITFVDKESNNEVKMVVLNVFNDTEDADLMLLCDDGSYILCDGQNDVGYAVLYMNASIDNDFEEGVTIFLNENGTPVMASTKDGRFIFKDVLENSFDFAYINNENEISNFYDVKLDVQSSTPLSTRKRSIIDDFVDPYIDAWHTLYYDGHFQWDEHNKKALVPFLCKMASFTITAGNAVWGTGQVSLVHTFFYEWYKSSYYHNDWADKLFYWTEMALLGSSGINIPNLITNGTVEITPGKFSLSYLAYLLNKYGDDELAKLGQINDWVDPLYYDAEKWKISLSTNLLEFQPDDEWQTAYVSSKAAWEIDDSQIDHSWCEVRKLDSQVAVHVIPNETGYDRSCSLKVYAKVSTAIASVTLTIKQSGIYFELSVDKLSFTQFGGSKPVSITASENIEEWEVTSYPSWCKIEKGNYTFWVDVDKNEGEPREGTITVTAITKGRIPVDRHLCVEQISSLCPDNNHPHAIDLGLPSGTKWCCCNVGASSPESYGGYYAWGETSTKSVYDLETYAYCNFNTGMINIGSDIAGTGYDAATVNMGAPWCMPSIAQLKELINNCSSQWTTQNDVNGFLVIGPNGGQVFLPAAGYRTDDELNYVGGRGSYWSSSLYPASDIYACPFSFWPSLLKWDYSFRGSGFSVRAVCP